MVVSLYAGDLPHAVRWSECPRALVTPPQKKLLGLGFYFFQNVVYRAVVVFVVSKILSGLIQQIFMTSSGSLIKAVKAKEAKYWLGNTQLGKRIPSDAREIQL